MARAPAPLKPALASEAVAVGQLARPENPLLRKAVNTLAIVPKSARITSLGRKCYNVLLYQAQEQGLEKDLFRAPLDAVVKGLDFDSKDYALVKKHLRAMVSTTVEWQSPTTGEGTSWSVSGLLAHAALVKQRGQVWVEWSYAVNLKQELLDPSVFARLRLEIVSQLRTHAGLALYEICTRYKDVKRTSRQAWRWWYPVLSGNPPSEKLDRLEYRIFKRDTLKPAIAEINAITDLDVELIEHKEGRFVDQIQFAIGHKKQTALPLRHPPQPVDLALVAHAERLGVPEQVVEALVDAHSQDRVATAVVALEKRLASAYPEPLRDSQRYLRAMLQAEPPQTPATGPTPSPSTSVDGATISQRELLARRRSHWQSVWTQRAHERCLKAIQALSVDAQNDLEAQLKEALQRRQAHPTLTKRLEVNGWQHPMVRQEMLKFFGEAAYGPDWDQPTTEQLLEVAAELGNAD